MEDTRRLPVGLKVIVGFHLLSAVAWAIGQGGAVVSYDAVARWGFQDPRGSLPPAVVEVNRGIGLADTVVQIPLFLMAAAGLWRRRFYGAVASWLVLGITVYWPVVAWGTEYFFQQGGIKHPSVDAAFIGVPGVILLFAMWASWYLFQKRSSLESAHVP